MPIAEWPQWVESRPSSIPGQTLGRAVNTSGGVLSCMHSGMQAMFAAAGTILTWNEPL
jgi:hypothetical protein